MKLLFDSYCKSEVAPGNYDFVIVSANVITCNNQLQVAFRLGKEDDDSYRAYLLQAYPIDLSAESEFIMLMKGAFCSIYPDFIIEADTDNLDMVCGFCNVNHDINGEAKIDIRSIEFTATMCGEIDLSDLERYLM
jgi:hypothetical protein